MKINIPQLRILCETPGAPGFESPIRQKIIEWVRDQVDEYHVDNLGNLITLKRGNRNPDGKKILLAAHMDEIGFVVTHIDEEGFLRFHTLGGFDPRTLTAQRVIVHGEKDLVGVMGTKPIHLMKEEEVKKVPGIHDYFIDLGMGKEEVSQWVSVGNPVTRERELIEMGDCINCKSIDNRISVYILIETLSRIKNHSFDVYGIFTVQEELGMRGANVIAHQIDPDYVIALDTTIAFDVPGAQAHEKVTELGKGAAIKIMDSSIVCDPRMVRYLKRTAEEKKIKWQPEVLTSGGTDTAMLQRMGKNGAISGAISIPTRYIHQVIEMAHKEDISNAIKLLCASVEQMDKWNWEH
jgi:putative aminopeptidase FrvX